MGPRDANPFNKCEACWEFFFFKKHTIKGSLRKVKNQNDGIVMRNSSMKWLNCLGGPNKTGIYINIYIFFFFFSIKQGQCFLHRPQWIKTIDQNLQTPYTKKYQNLSLAEAGWYLGKGSWKNNIVLLTRKKICRS